MKKELDKFLKETVPKEYDSKEGLSYEGLVKTYDMGAGDVDEDFDAINNNRVDFFFKPRSWAHGPAKPVDKKVVDAAVKLAWSKERRAECGFQICISFGAAGEIGGFELDGKRVKSGFEVVNYLHKWLSHFCFGSLKEGTRHIYFDWY